MKKNSFFAFLIFILIRTAGASEYNITDFGAVRNEISTSSIQKAIDACYENGGGTVVVPAGVFITGTIFLKSNINLYLGHGAELRSSMNLDDFKIASQTYGMIYCENAVNISITGSGTINAMGSLFYETDKNHVYDEFDRNLIRQKEEYQKEGVFCSDGPLERKPRPGMTIVFFHCNNVTIKDITIKDTPVWATRFGYC